MCHTRSASRCRARWQFSAPHARCRAPTRASGRNQRRHTQHGRFLRTAPATIADHAPYRRSNLAAAPPILPAARMPATRSAPLLDQISGSFLTSRPGTFLASVKGSATCGRGRLRTLQCARGQRAKLERHGVENASSGELPAHRLNHARLRAGAFCGLDKPSDTNYEVLLARVQNCILQLGDRGK